jgi:H+/Cl- antiporter ClcA
VQAAAIVMLCIASAIAYGILHDQVTARVCVEYFTIGHPPVFDTTSPTLLGLGWGIIATWWMGLLLGVPLAIAARAGRRPKRSVRSLVRPVAILLGVMATCALAAGLAGFLLASRGPVFLVEPLATEVPAAKHVGFLADLWAHSASYLVGFVGGLFVIARVWRSRGRMAAGSSNDLGRPAPGDGGDPGPGRGTGGE